MHRKLPSAHESHNRRAGGGDDGGSERRYYVQKNYAALTFLCPALCSPFSGAAQNRLSSSIPAPAPLSVCRVILILPPVPVIFSLYPVLLCLPPLFWGTWHPGAPVKYSCLFARVYVCEHSCTHRALAVWSHSIRFA